jgi:hypothetical protein
MKPALNVAAVVVVEEAAVVVAMVKMKLQILIPVKS